MQSPDDSLAMPLSSGPITRQRVLLGRGVLFNFLLPWAVYRLSEPHVGDSRAIMTSAAVPMVWSFVQFARSRKVDVMSVMVLSGIGMALVALALGGSPKLLLFRESLITGLAGLVLIGSAMIHRPLMHVLLSAIMRQQSAVATVFPSSVLARARAEWESDADKRWFRRVMTVTTSPTVSAAS